MTAQDWLNTLGPLEPVLSDSQATKYYRLLRESRETAQAFMTLDDFACPVALHIGYLDSCEARKSEIERLRASGLDVERERADLRTSMQGHHQQLSWDMVELAKALKNAGRDALADVPGLGTVSRKDILKHAEKHGRESHRMLAAGETHLTGPALHGAFGATKKNIALVLMEAGTDSDQIQALLSLARVNYDAHGDVQPASYREVGAGPAQRVEFSAKRAKVEASLCRHSSASSSAIRNHACCCADCAAACGEKCPVCRRRIVSSAEIVIP